MLRPPAPPPLPPTVATECPQPGRCPRPHISMVSVRLGKACHLLALPRVTGTRLTSLLGLVHGHMMWGGCLPRSVCARCMWTPCENMCLQQGMSPDRCARVCRCASTSVHTCARTVGAHLRVPGSLCLCLHVAACAHVCAVLCVPCMCIPTCACTCGHLHPPIATLLWAVPWQRVPRVWHRCLGRRENWWPWAMTHTTPCNPCVP